MQDQAGFSRRRLRSRRTALLQNCIDDLGNLEHRAILNASNRRAQLGEPARDFRDAAAHGAKRIEHHADPVLEHPLCVVALLRHRQGVAHDNDRQALMHRLADTAGTGLADEEIGEPHVMADLGRKSEH